MVDYLEEGEYKPISCLIRICTVIIGLLDSLLLYALATIIIGILSPAEVNPLNPPSINTRTIVFIVAGFFTLVIGLAIIAVSFKQNDSMKSTGDRYLRSLIGVILVLFGIILGWTGMDDFLSTILNHYGNDNFNENFALAIICFSFASLFVCLLLLSFSAFFIKSNQLAMQLFGIVATILGVEIAIVAILASRFHCA